MTLEETASLNFKDGSSLAFGPFAYNNNYLGKVQLLVKTGPNEGIWVCFSEATIQKYNDNNCFDRVVGMLANDALCFKPAPSWGMYIPVQLNGSNRPYCDMDWIDWSKPENRIFSPDVPA